GIRDRRVRTRPGLAPPFAALFRLGVPPARCPCRNHLRSVGPWFHSAAGEGLPSLRYSAATAARRSSSVMLAVLPRAAAARAVTAAASTIFRTWPPASSQ